MQKMQNSLTLMQAAGTINRCYLNGYKASFFHTGGRSIEQPQWTAFLRGTLHLNLQHNTKSKQS